MKNRDIRDYLQDILDSILEVKEFIENMEFEDFAIIRGGLDADCLY